MAYYLPIIGVNQDDLKTGLMNDQLSLTIPAPPGYVGFWPGKNVDTSGVIHDLTSNANHLLYTKGTVAGQTDAVALANPGYFSSGAAAANASAGFEVPISAFSPNPSPTANNGPGDSFVISAGFNFTTAVPTSVVTVGGNAGDINNLGFAWYIETDKTIQVYTRSSSGGFGRGKSIEIIPDVDHRITMYVDGVNQRMTVWYDDTIITNEFDISSSGTGLYYTANSPWWFGGGGAPVRNKSTQAVKWFDIHILLNRPGENNFNSPTYIANKLRREPGVMLTKLDLIR